MLCGFTVIKSFKAEDAAKRLFAGANARLEEAKYERRMAEKLLEMIGMCASVAAQMGVFLLGAYLAVTGRGVTPGMVVVFVQQSVFVFNSTLRENITMFKDFDDARVRRAMELSGLSALAAEKGENYPCGENGSGLSGGERQRVAIARSLLQEAPVLLSDEATAALDAQTAYAVTDAMLNADGLTRVLVTHRLEESLLRRFDGIIVMRRGEIVEQGSYDALMEQNGYFAALCTAAN